MKEQICIAKYILNVDHAKKIKIMHMLKIYHVKIEQLFLMNIL